MSRTVAPPLNVLAVAGSLKEHSVTRVVMRWLAAELEGTGCTVDVLDLRAENLPLFNPDNYRELPAYPQLQQRVHKADVILLGSPDYHGSIGGAVKNFLDYYWQEFAGKLFVPVVASHEKGLTVIDQIRTVARQCYAWTLPYGVSFAEKTDVAEGQIINATLRQRLSMLARDSRVYGTLLACQRQADLTGKEVCFMAKHRA